MSINGKKIYSYHLMIIDINIVIFKHSVFCANNKIIFKILLILLIFIHI